MKEIIIRPYPKSYWSNPPKGVDWDSIPFEIIIDGVKQKNVRRFAIDLALQKNINDYSYTLERGIEYE